MRSLLGSLSRPVRGSLDTFGDRVRGFLALVTGLLASARSSDLQLVENPLSAVREPGPDSAGRGAGAVAEVVGVTFRHGPEFVGGAALVVGDAIRVEVGFQLGVRPGVEGGVFGSISSRGEIGGDGGVAAASGLRSTGVAVLSLLEKVITGGTGLVRRLVILRGEPFPAQIRSAPSPSSTIVQVLTSSSRWSRCRKSMQTIQSRPCAC